MNTEINLSIVMPGVRPSEWDDVYKSILISTQKPFELIVVSPYPLSPFLQEQKNVKYVKDYGSPVRAGNIGLLLTEGKFVFLFHSDDARFLPDSIDKCIAFLESKGPDIKNIINCRFIEGKNYQPKAETFMYFQTWFYKLIQPNNPNNPNVPPEWENCMTSIWYREYLDKFGGFDCSYESHVPAIFDIAIRAQRDGATAWLTPDILVTCNQAQLDHAPIQIAQTYIDTPMYKERYQKPFNHLPIFLPHDNWKKAERVWTMRHNMSEDWKAKIVPEG